MDALFAVLAFLLTALPIAAQTKILKERRCLDCKKQTAKVRAGEATIVRWKLALRKTPAKTALLPI
jgi:hypothetical protein